MQAILKRFLGFPPNQVAQVCVVCHEVFLVAGPAFFIENRDERLPGYCGDSFNDVFHALNPVRAAPHHKIAIQPLFCGFKVKLDQVINVQQVPYLIATSKDCDWELVQVRKSEPSHPPLVLQANLAWSEYARLPQNSGRQAKFLTAILLKIQVSHILADSIGAVRPRSHHISDGFLKFSRPKNFIGR